VLQAAPSWKWHLNRKITSSTGEIQTSCYVFKEALPLNAHLPGYEGSIASIHAQSNELFETLSWRIAATRGSSFVKKFGWPFCMNGSSQSRHRCRSAAAFSESSGLRLFVIDHAQPQAGTDNPNQGFGEYGSAEPFQMRRTIYVLRPLYFATRQRPFVKRRDFRFGSNTTGASRQQSPPISAAGEGGCDEAIYSFFTRRKWIASLRLAMTVSTSRRPRERGDPYAAAYRYRTEADILGNNYRPGLWVPAPRAQLRTRPGRRENIDPSCHSPPTTPPAPPARYPPCRCRRRIPSA
jgi:hypothetical protein